MAMGSGNTASEPATNYQPPSFTDTWTYRSFNNEPDPEGDLRWWVAQIRLEHSASGIITGALAGLTSPETFDLVGYLDRAVLPTDREW
jgi:hypothetical protein